MTLSAASLAAAAMLSYPPAAQSKAPVKVGVLFPMTGISAPTGFSGSDGLTKRSGC
jgi:hypothetical protein